MTCKKGASDCGTHIGKPSSKQEKTVRQQCTKRQRPSDQAAFKSRSKSARVQPWRAAKSVSSATRPRRLVFPDRDAPLHHGLIHACPYIGQHKMCTSTPMYGTPRVRTPSTWAAGGHNDAARETHTRRTCVSSKTVTAGNRLILTSCKWVRDLVHCFRFNISQ